MSSEPKPCPTCGRSEWTPAWGVKIRDARRDLRISQVAFARDIGITAVYLRHIEQGKMLRVPDSIRAQIDCELGTG